MTAAQRREKARLRFRALAAGARHRAATARAKAVAGLGRFAPKARQEAALAIETSRRREVLARAERFVAELQVELATAARCQVITAAIIGELSVDGPEILRNSGGNVRLVVFQMQTSQPQQRRPGPRCAHRQALEPPQLLVRCCQQLLGSLYQA
jgi:hypothetical protein